MKMKSLIFILLLFTFFSCKEPAQNLVKTVSSTTANAPMIQLIERNDAPQIDILIDSVLFTSLRYPSDIEKPVLYPINTASGKTLTRGFPIAPRNFERIDHPHHVGHWFNFGDVNGLDFWNNSYNIPNEKKDKYGSVKLTSTKILSEGEQGSLMFIADWLDHSGNKLLTETCTFSLKVGEQGIVVDRTSTLEATETTVTFHDNKEGMFAVRTARALELPSDTPLVLTDAQGNPTEVPVMNNEKVTGNYLNSNGETDGAVWGKRAIWCRLSGEIEGEAVSISIIDHPENPGYPTYWHARPYGLFAANPLGQAVFSDGEEVLNFELQPNTLATFKYRMLISNEVLPTAEQLNTEAEKFSQK